MGKGTEYYTSASFKPTKSIAESSQTGPATVIISGLGTGMMSTIIPVMSVVFGIIFAFLFSAGFDATKYINGTLRNRNSRCWNALYFRVDACNRCLRSNSR
ncbi:MAG: sodium/proton-translocating pyrophosphatase [Melioribacteraceae bacterium]|nr:sodium/proton-translocating pyrophosphatase [Melioribacteraceae bacterium]